MNRGLEKKISTIRQDHISGSGEILEKITGAIEKHLIYNKNKPAADVVPIFQILTDSFPQMCAVLHFVNAMLGYLKDDAGIKCSKLSDHLEKYNKKWKYVNSHVGRNAFMENDVGSRTILMHSNSTALQAYVSVLKEENIDVKFIQTVSYPSGEGRKQAKIIAETGYPVTCIAECAVSRMIDSIDVAMVGADVISGNYFINKIGTHMIGLVCREYRKPFYILADSRKIINEKALPEKIHHALVHEKKKPPDGLWKINNENIFPLNYYFETIPNTLATKFITERGIHSFEEVFEFAKGVKFSGLHG